MNTDRHGLNPAAEQTFIGIGCAREVLNELGHGLHEKPYENALVVELRLRKVRTEQQRRFEVKYKGQMVGEFIPDLLVEDEVVVDTKVTDKITDLEIGQMLNYLRITRRRVGLRLNFKRAKLQWERVIL